MGVPLVDYHTAQVPASGSGRNRRSFPTRWEELNSRPRHDLKTILSRRDYRMDARADVALWARASVPPRPLEELREALAHPGFVLYLGRKSCPLALPVEAQVVTASSIQEAFALARFNVLDEVSYLPLRGSSSLYWEEGAVAGVEGTEAFERRDVPVSRRRWQFDVRREHHAPLGD